MAENLNYLTSSGSWCYDDNSSNCAKYGRLYNWETAQKVCPDGWHLPSDAEWTQLTNYLGGESVAGGKLKETGTIHWNSPNTGATNESGFTALPGGFRGSSGAFNCLGEDANIWSATEYFGSEACYCCLTFHFSDMELSAYYKTNGFSVRCVKDN